MEGSFTNELDVNAPGNTTSVSNNIDPQKCSTKCILKWLKMTGINLIAFGLELCTSAGFTYIPPLLLKSGFAERYLTMVMGIGPCISLLLVPAIAHWSDRCDSQFGRRRPFMLVLGLIMLLSLLLIPFSKALSNHSFDTIGNTFVLVAGIILLDFSSQALMNPCKSLIPDILEAREHNSGFTAYSCMLSMGGCIGYLISSINWVDTAVGNIFGGQEKSVFCLLAATFSFVLVINLFLAKETPLKNSNCYQTNISDDGDSYTYCDDINSFPLLPQNNVDSQHTTIHNLESSKMILRSLVKYFRCRHSCFSIKLCVKYCHCITSIPLKLVSVVKYSLQRFRNMPPVLAKLFVSTLFGWMGIMCHDVYYTDFVGQVLYQGMPKAENQNATVNLYDEGVRMGSWGLLLHCLSAALYAAFIQEKLIKWLGQRNAYMFGMGLFALSLIGTVVTDNIVLVNLFAAASGIGSAAITTVPYTLVTEYHHLKEKLTGTDDYGVGEDMAILDSAFYLAQTIPSFFLGYIVDFFHSKLTYMIAAAICGVISCLTSYFISFSSSAIQNPL